MKAALRNIAVTVVEARAGRFGWQLLEQSAEGEWRVLEEGTRLVANYAHALSDGLLRLQQMVDDLAQGPRQADGADAPGARISRRRRVPDDDAPEPEAPAQPAGSAFGFGSKL